MRKAAPAGERRRRSVRSRILRYSLLSSLAVAVLVVGSTAVVKSLAFSTSLKDKTRQSAARLAESLSLPTWDYLTKACDQIISSELADGDFSAIYLTENSGAVISAFGRSGRKGDLVPLGDDARTRSQYAAKARTSSFATVRFRDLDIGTVAVYATGDGSIVGLYADMAGLALTAILEGAIIALLAFLAADRLISRRVLRMSEEIGRFSDRDLAARSGDEGPDEIGALARAFNTMADTIQRHATGLEDAVAERTAELAEANRGLSSANEKLSETISQLGAAQEEIIESRRIAALGQLVAGIAHQLNTPLAAILSANRFLSDELRGRVLRITKDLSGIDEVDAAILEEMLDESMASDDAVDFSFLRARKRELSALFAEKGLPDPELLADLVVDANVHGLGSRLLEFLSNKRIRNILSVVESVNDIRSAGQVINTASERATNVVRALKVYSGQGQEGAIASVSLAEGLEDVLGLFPNATRGSIVLETVFDRGVKVMGRREQLELVWMNLIDNAIQAMGGRGNLQLTVEKEGGTALVRILDTGRGVPPEVKERLFDPFFLTGRHTGRLGIGLFTAKRIVEEHKGSISFESEPGRTVFTVTLPAQLEETSDEEGR